MFGKTFDCELALNHLQALDFRAICSGPGGSGFEFWPGRNCGKHSASAMA